MNKLRRFDSRESKAENGDRIFKKIERLSSKTGRAREREKAIVVSELRRKYSLKELLKLSGLARSTYYYYVNQKNIDKYECEKIAITELFNKNKCRYGYRRITIELKNIGYTINHKTVLKLMR